MSYVMTPAEAREYARTSGPANRLAAAAMLAVRDRARDEAERRALRSGIEIRLQCRPRPGETWPLHTAGWDEADRRIGPPETAEEEEWTRLLDGTLAAREEARREMAREFRRRLNPALPLDCAELWDEIGDVFDDLAPGWREEER